MNKKLLGFIMLLLGIPMLLWAIAQLQPKTATATFNECRELNASCNSDHHCCSGLTCGQVNGESGNGKCKPIPLPSPSCSPTPTPTPTPTETTCQKWDEGCPPVETPTPTATPEASPTPGTGSTGGTGGGNPGNTSPASAPAAATCNIPFTPPVLESITAGGSGILNVNWSETDSVDNFSINYGFVGSPVNMGVPNIPNTSTSYPISLLPSGSSINAQVCAYKNGCGECSAFKDPKAR